jgi:hypothetical protein
MPRFALVRATPLLALAAFLPWGAPPARAQTAVDAFRAKTEQWVETRQLISQEETDWEADRETLRATRDLLEQQREALAAEIAELEESNTASDDERRDLLLERGDYQRAGRALEEKIRALEEEVLAAVPRLPGPLQEKLELLLVQIPADPAKAAPPLGQRLMNVLGVLAQAEKFNGTATFVGETRAVGGEQKVRVRTLYWGLAQAVYAGAQGRTAGIGRPGPEGWEFTDDPGLASDARRLLDIYEGNVDAIEFVRLPMEIRGDSLRTAQGP